MNAPTAVIALNHHAGTAGGQSMVLLSLECWPESFDLRFARLDDGEGGTLPRRVPPPEVWSAVDDCGTSYRAVDAVGRGDRERTRGEVTFEPALDDRATKLAVRVQVVPGSAPLDAAVVLRRDQSDTPG